MQSSEWLSDLKIRGSWGKTGFYGNTDPYNQFTTYGGTIADAAYDIFGNSTNPVQGFRAVRIGEPETGWQEDVVTNLGFESILWNGRLSITADWYHKKAKGLLFRAGLPDVVGGATRPNINVGIIQNNGLDILLGSKGKIASNWQWDATVTLTTYKNKILKLNDLPFFIPDFSIAGPFVRNAVGQPAGAFYGHKVIGIFENDDEVTKAPVQDGKKPGRFRYLDANNDNIINDEDRVYFGDPNPDFTTGINIGFSYKSFDFSAFFYGCFGNDVINTIKFATDFYPTGATYAFFPPKSRDALYNSWTPQNTNAKIPMLETDINFSNIGVVNSYLLEDGSYFRNKSMILGYNFSKALLQKMKIEKMRVYIQAVNLFTFTKYSSLDPELSGHSAAFGIDFGNYPNNQKQFLFGLGLNF